MCTFYFGPWEGHRLDCIWSTRGTDLPLEPTGPGCDGVWKEMPPGPVSRVYIYEDEKGHQYTYGCVSGQHTCGLATFA